MARPIVTSSFPELSLEDTVSLTIYPAAANMVTFSLEKDPKITWWKAIEVYSSSGQLLSRAEMQDGNNGPIGFSLATTDLVGARLILAKAKVFGVHTGMYELSGLTAYNGRRLDFLWQRDDDRDGPVAGFFRDLGGAINIVADAVATVVETIVNTIAEIAKTIIESIGTFIANIIDSFGNLLGNIPGVGSFFGSILHWAATVVSAAFSFAASFVKAFIEMAGGASAGIIRVAIGAIGGLFSLNPSMIFKGLSDIVAVIVGPTIAVVGKLTAFIQSVFTLQTGERRLTEAEATMLRRVFRNSVFLYNVRVVDGFAGLFSTNPRPFTLGNTIYMKDYMNDKGPSQYLSTLVHECVHVWQNQHNGQRYIADALWGQFTRGADTYNWTGEFSLGRLVWRDFNREAQASFMAEVFDFGRQNPALGTVGEFFNDDPIGFNIDFRGPQYTDFARDSVTYMRSISPLVNWR